MTLFPDPNLEELYELNAVHKAVVGLEDDTIEQIISCEPYLINKSDRFGRSPLTWAVMRGAEDIIDLLLSSRAQVDQVNNLGSSPLMIAAVQGRVGPMKMLLEAGAVATLGNQMGLTALHYLLQSAIEPSRHIQALEDLLEAGSDINAQSTTGETPLYIASEHGRLAQVEFLICRGADQRICEHEGNNPLSIAVQANRYAIAKSLLDRGGDHLGPILSVGTFVHLVAYRANVDILRLLLNHRLEPREINIKNDEGLMPRQVGFKRNDTNAEWKDLFLRFLKSINQDLPHEERESARPYSYELPKEIALEEAATEISSSETSTNLTAVDSESSEDEFMDAVDSIDDLSLQQQQQSTFDQAASTRGI